MDTEKNRELNHMLNCVRNTARIALVDAERAANGSSCHTVAWVETSAKSAYRAAQAAHDAFYDWDLHDIMEAEEELEAQEEERASYVNRVHAEIFPGR